MKSIPSNYPDGRDPRQAADKAVSGAADDEQAQAQAAWQRLRADETDAQRTMPAGTDGIGASPAGGGPLGTTGDAITGLTGDPAGGAASGETGETP